LFRRSAQPVQLTNGPLSFGLTGTSNDGKQIFSVGSKLRGELVRFDMNAKEFVPFLSGISAFGPTFSRNGDWVAYTAYPDHTLWRSRADGSDRLQLTYPPMRVRNPFISPDGKRVAYGDEENAVYVISMEGGAPQRIVEKGAAAANWSLDGNLLVFTSPTNDAVHQDLEVFDLRTGKRGVLSGSQDLIGGQWVAQDLLVAAQLNTRKLVFLDVKTQKSFDLAGTETDVLINWLVRQTTNTCTTRPEAKNQRSDASGSLIERSKPLRR
jgi:hypothetical protein